MHKTWVLPSPSSQSDPTTMCVGFPDSHSLENQLQESCPKASGSDQSTFPDKAHYAKQHKIDRLAGIQVAHSMEILANV